jgi:transcriptional regulator with XRE-family HTH domain
LIDIKLTEREFYTLWRRRNNIKLKEIAQYLNCTDTLICKFEKGKCNISPDKIEAYNNYILEKTR